MHTCKYKLQTERESPVFQHRGNYDISLDKRKIEGYRKAQRKEGGDKGRMNRTPTRR